MLENFGYYFILYKIATHLDENIPILTLTFISVLECILLSKGKAIILRKSYTQLLYTVIHLIHLLPNLFPACIARHGFLFSEESSFLVSLVLSRKAMKGYTWRPWWYL